MATWTAPPRIPTEQASQRAPALQRAIHSPEQRPLGTPWVWWSLDRSLVSLSLSWIAGQVALVLRGMQPRSRRTFTLSSMSIAAMILAAGGSRRLGKPKQLIICDGETLLNRAIRLA